jgi:hypothetical protein
MGHPLRHFEREKSAGRPVKIVFLDQRPHRPECHEFYDQKGRSVRTYASAEEEE